MRGRFDTATIAWREVHDALASLIPVNETAATASSFKGAFAKHHCIVPANAWRERVPI